MVLLHADKEEADNSLLNRILEDNEIAYTRITSYNVCYTKLLRHLMVLLLQTDTLFPKIIFLFNITQKD